MGEKFKNIIIKIWDGYVSILIWCIIIIDDKLKKRGDDETFIFRYFGGYVVGRFGMSERKEIDGERNQDR